MTNYSAQLPPLTLETATASSWYDTVSNRIVNPNLSGWLYDGAGNVTSIGGMQRTFTYDGENRQVSATINQGSPATYTYDGEGRRVMKTTSAGTTNYVYDAFGHLVAEYNGPVAAKRQSESTHSKC